MLEVLLEKELTWVEISITLVGLLGPEKIAYEQGFITADHLAAFSGYGEYLPL